MMNLLVSTSLFYPSRLGGPANTVYWLAKGLARSDVKVTVVTTNGYIKDDWVKADCWLSKDGIRIRYCQRGLMCIPKMLCHTLREMKSADVVMLCDLFQKQVFFTALMARLFKKQIIWSPRGELFLSAIGGSRLKVIYIKFVKHIFGQYAKFHATSEDEKELIINNIGEKAKVVVMPNYIELPELQIRQDETPSYLLYLGRIAPIKAIDKLIEGLALSESFRNSTFLFKIAGGVENQFIEYYNQLKRLIIRHNLQEKVFFIGPVSGKEKFQTYANAHTLFLVSESENFGNVIIEALSQGTPVVASTGTPWSILEEMKAGYWIDNTPDEISKAIDRVILQSPKDYTNMRKNAYALGDTFDINKNISHWIDALSTNFQG